MLNFDLQYRPLRPGTSILNGRIKEPGTIGLFGRDDQGAAWLVSCYHVLCDCGLAKYTQDDVIYQPAAALPNYAVGKTDAARAVVDLDCAAALISDGIQVISWIPGLGPITQTAAPAVNARVLKVGAAGGLTEGIVTQVSGTAVTIRTDPAFPRGYAISEAGDSGALWIDQASGAAVALHRGLRDSRTATATLIDAVLESLRLKLT